MRAAHPVGSMTEDGHSRQRKWCRQRPGRNSSRVISGPREGQSAADPRGRKVRPSAGPARPAQAKALEPQGLSLEVFSSRSSRFSLHFIFPSIVYYFTISERKVEKSYPKTV